jgi:hypothetical protein
MASKNENAPENRRSLNTDSTPFFLTAQRVKDNQVDFSGRTGMSLAGWFPKSPMDDAIEYFGYDWEMGEVKGEREYRA